MTNSTASEEQFCEHSDDRDIDYMPSGQTKPKDEQPKEYQ